MSYHEPTLLRERGLILPAPDHVFVSKDVLLDRLEPGVVLHPGSRVEGSKTLLQSEAEIGTEGPARVKDCAFGPRASIASGSADACVLLSRAKLGPNTHARGGTLLEEEANTAHAVGLKQTILMSFTTLGSEINFCDALMAGGGSRKDHSEVGSGFIHFNFTPFGATGDKATASLFGDVPRGVLLRSDRIFLGGAGGVVGPVTVGFGTTLGAGSVYRRSYGEGLLVYSETLPAKTIAFDPLVVRSARRRFEATTGFVAQLHAMIAWYEQVRFARAQNDGERSLVQSALVTLKSAVDERRKQGERLAQNLERALRDRGEAYGPTARTKEESALNEWKNSAARLEKKGLGPTLPSALSGVIKREGDHLAWVNSLDEDEAQLVQDWLSAVVASYRCAAL